MFYWFVELFTENTVNIVPWLNSLPGINTGNTSHDGMYEGFIVEVKEYQIYPSQKFGNHVVAKCECQRYNRIA